MSFLYKRGRYWWYGRGAYRRSTRATSKHIARQIQRKWDDEYALELAGIRVAESMNIQQLVVEFSRFKDFSRRSRLGINHFLSFVGPKTDIQKITTKTINEFILWRREQGRAPNTIKNDLIPVKQVFNYAVANNYLPNNPVQYAMSPGNQPVKPRSAIPKEKIQEIFERANPQDKVYWMVCYYTGLSCSDAGTLQPGYVKNNVIYTTRSKTKVPVPIPLHPKLLQLGKRIYNCMPKRGQRDQSNRRFKVICESLGIENGVVYSLRHSFISHLFDLGLSLEDIKVVAGHTTSTMTTNYTHAQIKTIKSYLEKLQ